MKRTTSLSVVSITIMVALVSSCAVNKEPVEQPVSSPSPTVSASSDPSAPLEDSITEEQAPLNSPSVPSAPRSVNIDKISLEKDLITLGFQDDGSLEVPQNFDDVGWFTGGGLPGGNGPVVIAGHVDSKSGPAVFYDLRDLQVGDEVEVSTENGSTVVYKVVKIQNYAKDAFPTAEVFGATSHDSLRLITCGGEFDRSLRSYTDNLVVYADAI